jgi:hypothetical protein
LTVRIKTNVGLLSPYLRKKLNPLVVRLMSIKDIPFKTEPKYKPIYARLSFIDGTEFQTRELPQQPNCKFDQKFLFLTGTHN